MRVRVSPAPLNDLCQVVYGLLTSGFDFSMTIGTDQNAFSHFQFANINVATTHHGSHFASFGAWVEVMEI